MRLKNYITFFFILTLLLLGIQRFIKNNDDSITALITIILIICSPLLIAFICSLFRKKLFLPVFWSLTILLLLTVVLTHETVNDFGTRSQKDNFIVGKYFSNKAGFFTPFATIIIYNQELDSNSFNREGIIKCVYRMGKKLPENYYIGKVKIENDKVIKEFYNQRIIDDKAFAKKEFSQELKYTTDAMSLFDSTKSLTGMH